MIVFSIVPAGFATLYYIIPMMTGRMWYSNKLGWMHMVGYMIGTVIGFDDLGLEGLVRKAEIFPLIPAYITPEVIASTGAIIADAATLVWLGNLLLTLFRGRSVNFDEASVGDVISTVGMALQAPNIETGLTRIKAIFGL